MKTANAALLALLADPNKGFIVCDLWKITLKNGLVLLYTDLDKDVKQGAETYKASACLIQGGGYSLKPGLEVDECEVTAYPQTTETINGVAFLEAVQNGTFDRATVKRQRQYISVSEAAAAPLLVTPAANAPTVFLGEITDAEITRTSALLRIKSLLNLLNVNMPRRQYQAQCSWVFGSTECGVNKSLYAIPGTVTAGSFPHMINCTLGQQSGYFNHGILKMTSGKNAGLSRTVKSWVRTQATLSFPFPNPVAVGDTFLITPGCSKLLNSSGIVPVTAAGTVAANSTTIVNHNIYKPATYGGGGGFPSAGFMMKFTSGANNGGLFRIQAWSWSPAQALLYDPLTQNIVVGDTFQIVSFATASGSQFALGGAIDSGAITVGTALSKNVIKTTLGQPNGYFNGGKMRFTNGANANIERTVSLWQNGIATLSAALPFAPNPNDAFTITQANNAGFATCTYYNNTARFGGQPYVPAPETAI